jgi:hypothetical protein
MDTSGVKNPLESAGENESAGEKNSDGAGADSSSVRSSSENESAGEKNSDGAGADSSNVRSSSFESVSGNVVVLAKNQHEEPTLEPSTDVIERGDAEEKIPAEEESGKEIGNLNCSIILCTLLIISSGKEIVNLNCSIILCPLLIIC